MAEVKNSFLSSKMNKDLDDRLIPNGEYRNAVNVSINKSTGENVGTVQTVLGNKEIVNIGNALGKSNLEFIGTLPDDVTGNIFCFLTNNILSPYIPTGAVGINSTFPQEQGTFPFSGQLLNGGSGYALGAATSTTTGSGTGMTFNITEIDGGSGSGVGNITVLAVSNEGSGYVEGDVVNIVQSTNSSAEFVVNTLTGPVTLTAAGTGYTTSNTPGTTTASTGSGTGLTLTVDISAGSVTGVGISSFGSGYAVGDTVVIDGGNNDAVLTINSILPNDNFIVSYNVSSTSLRVLAQGSFLNFSTLNPVTGINLLEKLLFFTDNRNQPRKINIDREASISNPAGDYYTTEDQLSVAKYYPYDPIQLYQPSQEPGTIAVYPGSGNAATFTVDAVTNSKTLTLQTPSTDPDPTSLFGSLGVLCTNITITNGGTGYNLGSNISTDENVTGTGLLVTITEIDGGSGSGVGVITGVTVASAGSNYTSGTTVRVIQPTSNDNAILTIDFVTKNTFIDFDQPNWPNSIDVNFPQTLPAGSTISLVYQETTLQDAISEYLPVEADAVLQNAASSTTFSVFLDTYVGDQLIAGTNVFVENPASGVFNDTDSVVTSAAINATPVLGRFVLDVVVAPAITNADYVAALTTPAPLNMKFSIANPYFDQVFKDNANVDFLNDKFVRFSYRFKFDDGEYSLMAPFTQPCFIPEQDGYFTLKEFGRNQNGFNDVSDTDRVLRSTVVEFMKNKVNKILLNIPLPCAANDIINEYKIQEIDILYKESDQTTIKVVETVPVQFNVVGSDFYYQYEYGSKPPFKTLPQSETVRVYDKVPVKALAQEVASNRIIYGNYQDKHTPPNFLDYLVGSRAKETTFTVTEDGITDLTSSIEYPNASLKQNRNYEIGVVLADRFGRQSTVLFSQTKLNFQSSFLASTVYTPYRSESDDDIGSVNPPNGLPYFDGNALRIQFNNLVSSFKNTSTGVPGLYNSDITSPDYNPLGWHSFKIVVKQTQQDYYNVYLPTAMAAYPLDPDQEIETTSHITLFGDNINKVPRSLVEVGPQQKEFGSDVKLFGRVFNSRVLLPLGANKMSQYYPERASDSVSVIGTIKDLFDYREFTNLTAASDYLFYNYEYTSSPSTPTSGESSFPDSSSLVARVNTERQFGIPVPVAGYFSDPTQLNVYETSPVESLIDIYYETTTAGTVQELNNAIEAGPAANVFSIVTPNGPIAFRNRFKENLLGANGGAAVDIECTVPFRPLRIGGAEFSNPSENGCILNSVNNNLAQPFPNDSNEDGIPYNAVVTAEGIFSVQNNGDGSFNIILTKTNTGGLVNNAPGLVVAGGTDPDKLNKSYTYDFDLTFTNPEAEDFNYLGFTGVTLENVAPSRPIVEFPQPGAKPTITFSCCTVDGAACDSLEEIFTTDMYDISSQTGIVFGVNGTNGSSTESLEKKDLTYSITRLAVNNGDGTFFQTIYDASIAGFNSEFFLDGYFSIENYGETGFQAGGSTFENPNAGLYNGYQAIISVDKNSITNQTLVEANKTYQMVVTARDGGVEGQDALYKSCLILFKFSLLPLIQFPYTFPDEVEAVGSNSTFYNFTPDLNFGNGQVWIGTGDAPSIVNGINVFGAWQQNPDLSSFRPGMLTMGRLQVTNAPVKIEAILTIFRPDGQTPPNNTPETLSGSVLAGNDSTNYTPFSLQNTAPGTPGTQNISLNIPSGTSIVPSSTLTMLGSFILPAGYGLSGDPQTPNLRIVVGDLLSFGGPIQTTQNFGVRVMLKATPA